MHKTCCWVVVVTTGAIKSGIFQKKNLETPLFLADDALVYIRQTATLFSL